MEKKMNASLVSGIENFRPNIEEKYKRAVRSNFWYMVEDLGSLLKSVSNNRRWCYVYSNLIAGNIKVVKKDPNSYMPHNTLGYVINEELLERNAVKYADYIIAGWLTKINGKLGAVTNVKVFDFTQDSFSITCKRGDEKIFIVQNSVFKYSSKGTPFYQWPALIYVNGKKTSEKDFKASAK